MSNNNWSPTVYRVDTGTAVEASNNYDKSYWGTARPKYFPGDFKINEQLHPNLNVLAPSRKVKGHYIQSQDAVPVMVAVDAGMYTKNGDESHQTGINGTLIHDLLLQYQPFMYMMKKLDVVYNPRFAVSTFGHMMQYTGSPAVPPLQVSGFYNNNDLDQDVSRLVLEGDMHHGDQLFCLLGYYINHYIRISTGAKGYLFIVTDSPIDAIGSDTVASALGIRPTGKLDPKSIFDGLAKQWNTFFIVPNDRKIYRYEPVAEYQGLVGLDHVFMVPNMNAVSALMTYIVGLGEKTLKLQDLAVAMSQFNDIDAIRARTSIANMFAQGVFPQSIRFPR